MHVSNDGDGTESARWVFIMWESSLRNNLGRFLVGIEEELVGDGS